MSNHFINLDRRTRLGAALISLAALGSSAFAQSGPKQIFRLGQFDGSSYEFASGYPDHTVRVDMGQEDIGRSWYGFQPSAALGGSSQETALAPRTVVFRLSGKPVLSYTVKVALLFEHASIPALRVTVNGHSGIFYASPHLDSRMGDGGAVSFPAFSQSTISFEVPGRFLHSGGNEIAFSAEAAGDGAEVPDAGFNYDAISMCEGDSEESPAVQLSPTIFYRMGSSGLEEAVDVLMRSGAAPLTSVSVTLAGNREVVPVSKGPGWGEQKARLYFPVFLPHSKAQIELQTRNQVFRSIQILEPAKRWTVYIVPHVHLDIGYTDYQAKVASVQSRIADEALDLIAVHPEFRFSLDGMWSLEQFLKTRTAEDRSRALSALAAEKLFVPAQYANELTGFASAETLIRSLYPSAQFAAQHHLPLNYANITDVPSYSWSYASILASSGIDELAAGSNNGRAPVLLRGHLDENSPFWWQGPDGKKVLFWYARHYHQMWTLFGLPPLVNAGEQMLPVFLQMYGKPTYKADAVLVYGSQVENTDLYPAQASLAEQWNRKYTFPILKYAGFHDALSSIAAQFHGNLPTVRGDGGPYWEDGIAADAYYAAMERNTEARVLSAEKLATVTSLVDPRIAVNRSEFNRLWKNILLMDEHTWLSSESYSDSEADQATVQLAVKDSRADAANLATGTLLRHGMADLADSIDVHAGSLVVFNPLNWTRSGMVSVDLRKGNEVVDNVTARVVPTQESDHGEHTTRVTFRAEDVPAVGYRTYSIHRKEALPTPENTPIESTLENGFYRVELDANTGAIRSIFDKQLGREVTDTASRYRFGQYLYVTTDNSASGSQRFVVHGSTAGTIISVTQSADSLIAQMESSDTNTPTIKTSIELPNREKKILLIENIEKKETKDDEAVYFAFPLAMTHPQFEYEIQNGVVDPARDMYPGAGLDWFSVQHWAAAQQDGLAAAIMPLDAPLVTFGDITRLSFPTLFGPRRGSIFSYAMNNYWHTNYRAAQGGHFQFRYVFTSSGKIDAAALSRQGWEEATPLEVSEVTASDKAVETKRPLNGAQGSFLSTSDPALLLQTWKPAEDGRGTILRFVDLGGAARTVHVELPHISLVHVWMTDALERDQRQLALAGPHGLDFAIEPHAIVTLRIESPATVPPACGRFCDMPH